MLWLPPVKAYHLLPDPWRIVLAITIIILVLWGLIKCWKSDACAGVGPLIMLMPGAHAGAVLILVVVLATVLLPFTSNMFETVTAATNPTGFFLLLPSLCFAVLFCGMSIHWVWLLAEGELPPCALQCAQGITHLRLPLFMTSS